MKIRTIAAAFVLGFIGWCFLFLLGTTLGLAWGATLRACFIPSTDTEAYRTKQCVGPLIDCPTNDPALWVPVTLDVPSTTACATPAPNCDCSTIFDVFDPPTGVDIDLSFHVAALQGGEEIAQSNVKSIVLGAAGPIPTSTTSSTVTTSTAPSGPTSTTLPFLGWRSVDTAATIGADRKRAVCWPLTEAKMLGRCHMYLAGGSTATSHRFVVYRATGALPDALVMVTPSISVAASQPAGWVDFPEVTVPLAPGTYCLGNHSGGTGALCYSDPGPVDYFVTTDAFSDGTSNPWGATNEHYRLTLSAYCDLLPVSQPTTTSTTASTTSSSSTSSSSSSSTSSSSTSSSTSTSSTTTTTVPLPPEFVDVWIRQSDGSWISSQNPTPGAAIIPVFRGTVP